MGTPSSASSGYGRRGALARPRYLAAQHADLPDRGEGSPEVEPGGLGPRPGGPEPGRHDERGGCPDLCRPGRQGPGGRVCGAELGLEPGAYNWQLYQPADRFWLFQGIDPGIFVVLAVLLLYFAVRRVRRIA